MGRRAQERRAAKDLARHVVENQIAPQLAVQRLRAEGEDVDVGWVDTSNKSQGFTVSCTGCGRTATMLRDPGTRVALCPQCQRNGRA